MNWYRYLLSCWINQSVTAQQLDVAVSKGFITEQQKEEIMLFEQKAV